MNSHVARCLKPFSHCRFGPWSFLMAVIILVNTVELAIGQERENDASIGPRTISQKILTETEWQEVEAAVDRGLAFLIHQQRSDGSFQAIAENDPGISGLCVLALMSRGHIPRQGPYGNQLDHAVNFLLDSQQSDGLFSRQRQSFHSPYNHGICSLVIAELYGMCGVDQESRFRGAIEKALEFTSRRYSQPKLFPDDEGSWRYLKRHGDSDGDLSVTSWSVMFLRSAKNSGFEVDTKLIDDALAYMKRNYDPRRKTFRYQIHTNSEGTNYPRGMAGAGALSLSLSGEHHSELAQNAAKHILKLPFDQYSHPAVGEKYPCYGAFYCSQGMFHMAGEYWSEYYPRLVKTLLRAQRSDGSWVMHQGEEARYGQSYVTALTVLALTPPYQMLPIFQR